MSAWSDAGWPSGIFFSRPRLAVNLIIVAVNELRVFCKMSTIATISEFTSPSLLRSTLFAIDTAIIALISNRLMRWDYNRSGTDRSGWYPTWLEEAVGDLPQIGSSITGSNILLRWVISRYKILCNCNRFSDLINHVQSRGVFESGYLNFATEAARTAYVTSELDNISYISFLIAAQFKYENGYYKVRTASCARLRVTAPSNTYQGNGRYICACKITDPGYGQFDSALAPVAANELWWSTKSPIVNLGAASVDATIYDQYWTYPYSISPGTATVGIGFSMLTRIAVDFSDRAYYDPPEVWQGINA